jgi:hypothetical protein
MLGLNTTTQYLACHSQSPSQASLRWLSRSHVEAETSPCSVTSDLDVVMIFSSVWTGVNGIRKAEQSLPASNACANFGLWCKDTRHYQSILRGVTVLYQRLHTMYLPACYTPNDT